MLQVFSLISQKDNAVNIEIARASHTIAQESRRDNAIMKHIAEDSKAVALATARDSAAMRVIAAATILFLPATFTAVSIFLFGACPSLTWQTLFSTSFFNFQPTGHGVSSWIWLYWVVTATLTVIIQTTWYFMSRRKEQEITKFLKSDFATDQSQDNSELPKMPSVSGIQRIDSVKVQSKQVPTEEVVSMGINTNTMSIDNIQPSNLPNPITNQVLLANSTEKEKPKNSTNKELFTGDKTRLISGVKES
jgi:hypothetical protein